MSATKIIAIVTGDHDADDLVSIVRRALLAAGATVDSVDAHAIVSNAVLYVDLCNGGGRRYVLAVPSRLGERHVDWTSDIDTAKVCNGPRSIDQTRAEVGRRTGIMVEVLPV